MMYHLAYIRCVLDHCSGTLFVVKKPSTCYQMMNVSVMFASLLSSGLPVNAPAYQVQNMA